MDHLYHSEMDLTFHSCHSLLLTTDHRYSPHESLTLEDRYQNRYVMHQSDDACSRACKRYVKIGKKVTQQYLQKTLGHYYYSVVVLLVIVRVVVVSVGVLETALAASSLSPASLWTIATTLASPRFPCLVVPGILFPVF